MIIFVFLSFDSEVRTDGLVKKAFSDTKIVAIPRIQHKGMIFHQINSLETGLIMNNYGIREPASHFPVIKPDSLQPYLVIVPGLAFDKKKNRLGRGGGFYDRFISKIRKGKRNTGVILGVCFF